MLLATRFDLIGKRYRTPRFRIGDIVTCSVRGEVTIVGISDGKIPWPIGKTHRARAPVVYKDLERAVRTESNQAVCHWWGITGQTVTKWKKALGVDGHTAGTVKLRQKYGAEPEAAAKRATGLRAADLTDRNRKIAEAKKGKARPPWLRLHMRKINTGKKLTAETRQKLSEVHRARGTRPKNGTKAWTPEEDRLVATLPTREVVELTGRSPKAIYSRRVRLRMPDGRRG
jgi:hypothetical protein